MAGAGMPMPGRLDSTAVLRRLRQAPPQAKRDEPGARAAPAEKESVPIRHCRGGADARWVRWAGWVRVQAVADSGAAAPASEVVAPKPAVAPAPRVASGSGAAAVLRPARFLRWKVRRRCRRGRR